MDNKSRSYRAIFSSDWSECLSPTGPFDFISFIYPDLEPDLKTVFKQYTSNQISLGDASKQIEGLLPSAITEDQMDAYLDDSFATYKGVPDLIEWCLSRNILFMINTTAMVGYFQRVFAKGLIPQIPVLSANPLIQYANSETDPETVYPLYEIQDKGKNSEAAIQAFNIPNEKVMLMGDSGGDGAHFEWGAKHGAFLIGSMTKASLS
jgi:2-hydroxy-3-keto-5-methylthiopentenyl-1-phosphate phosphatase